MSSGSLVFSASSSPCGIENGLCEKSTCFVSSFHSNIGKSTIQQNSKRSSSTSFRSVPTLVRAGAGELGEDLGVAGDEEGGVALPQAQLAHQRRRSRSGPRFLAIGPPQPPWSSRQKM